ncbi:response regulator transcription factor [Lacrimispora indolis]|uniref:response regulator transcription factor n=1 Tax=Lacrimispora indolis TaxID=69825 RepID=UPI000408FA75|nr:response regulator [[Clostridium] methoxybenzovorans]
MRLLIVDDQPGVLHGLLNGIDWKKKGFETVKTAQNAMKAKEVFREQAPDVMLCDIEMPEENGLLLFQWVCSEKYDTYCIFLTSHAEFAYAQRALHLGAFDYILQPAPYEEIVRAVRKAVQNVEKRNEKRLVYDMGQAFQEQEISIAANVQRDYLLGINNQNYFETLAGLGCLPVKGRPCHLVLIQIVRWYSLSVKWNGPSLAEELSRLVNGIFITNSCPIVVCFMEENMFAMVLQDSESMEVRKEELKCQLLYFSSVCEQSLKCGIACYLEGPLYMKEMPSVWPLLVKQKQENVILKGGIFTSQKQEDRSQNRQYHMAGIRYWGKLLMDGYPQVMEEEAFHMLDQMVEDGTMDAQTLLHFYQDFLSMLYGAIDDSKELLYKLFSAQDELSLYQNGMKSVSQMKELVHHVAVNYLSETENVDSKTAVFQLIQYVNDHLDCELKREELAEHVHLNPDYMTRIFKKEMGVTVKEYIIQRKMREAKSLLKTTSLPVSFIAAKLAYCNFSHFTQAYKKVMGITPQEERNLPEESK